MKVTKSVFFLALASVPFSFAFAANEEVPMTAKQAQSLGVETARVAQVKATKTLGLPARVILPNNQLFVVSAPLAGFIEKMQASVNQHVKKDEVIAQMQSPPLAEAERAYLQAYTQYQLAREVMLRDQKLFEEGIISQSRHSASQSRYIEAGASLSVQKEMLKLAGLSGKSIDRLPVDGRIGSTLEIRSPIEGVVLEQTGIAGQRIDAAAPIYRVAKLSPLWLDIEVPAAALHGMKEKSAVSVPEYDAFGEVSSIGKSVKPTSQTVMVRALMTRHIEGLKPGLKVEATISGASGDMQQIPNAALTRIDGKPSVFVKTAKGFMVKHVDLVNEGESSSMVGGLSKDEVVAVHGVAALKAAISGTE
ncbi:MAG: HlyD family efflux transporter periplasmic adaptor subunit [Burkholderiales bacterium]|nr:HlyD family efflux transporter periplasmic adaptor subunit [Burkholderiales bacterium]